METHNERPLKPVKDDDGNEFYCEAGLSADSNDRVDDLTDRCVESDVVRRYSGNIHIES